MKKLISFALAVVLCFSMSATVFAAPSPEMNVPEINSPVVDNTVVGNTGSIASPVKPVVQAGHSLNAAQQATVASYGTVEKMFESVSNVQIKNFDEKKVVTIDLEADIPAGGAWVEIMKWSDIQFGENDNSIIVLHMNEAGQLENISWQIISTNDAGPVIVGFFTSLSPVWIAPVEYEIAINGWYYDPAIDGPIDPSLPAGSGISPKTADNSMSLYVVMLAVAACGVMVCKTRKVK